DCFGKFGGGRVSFISSRRTLINTGLSLFLLIRIPTKIPTAWLASLESPSTGSDSSLPQAVSRAVRTPTGWSKGSLVRKQWLRHRCYKLPIAAALPLPPRDHIRNLLGGAGTLANTPHSSEPKFAASLVFQSPTDHRRLVRAYPGRIRRHSAHNPASNPPKHR